MKHVQRASFKRDKRNSASSPVFEQSGSREWVQQVEGEVPPSTTARGRTRRSTSLDSPENPFANDVHGEGRTTASPNGDSRTRPSFDGERPNNHNTPASAQPGIQRSRSPSPADSDDPEETRRRASRTADLPANLRRRASRTASIVVPSGEGFIRRLKPTLVLQNSGSVARDHLASERTFLAYVRTSLAIASSGVGLIQLFSMSISVNKPGRVLGIVQRIAPELGATIVGFGVAVLFVGITRYFTVQSALTQGNFPVARLVVLAISVALIVLTTVVFGVLLAGRIQTRGL